MKASFEKPPLLQSASFYCERVRQPADNAMWHFHPEYQITLVLRGGGYRLVGDKLTPLEAGDLVFLGSNLPHVWRQEGWQLGVQEAGAIIERCFHKGLLLFAPVGAWGQTVKIAPPLTIPRAAMEEGLAVLSEAVDEAVSKEASAR